MSQAQGEGRTLNIEFEGWWLKLIQREPNFSQYLKVKRICHEAFMAGMEKNPPMKTKSAHQAA